MRLGKRKLWVGAVAVLVAVVAGGAWAIAGTDGLVGVLLAVAVGGLSAIGFFVAQAERRVVNHVATFHRASRSELLALQELLALNETAANVLSEQIEALNYRIQRPGAQAEQLLHAFAAGYRRVELAQGQYADRLREALESANEQISKQLNESFRQYEALSALYIDTGATAGFPATRSWVASPDLLLYLHHLVRSTRLDHVVECGSGLSTVIMAYAVRDKGRGRIVALEHLEEYADRTRELLEQHGVTDWAEVRLAQLEDVTIDEEVWPWYRLEAVPEGPIDLLFVDGPPGHTKPLARFPAVPLLIERLSAHAVVVLDDHNRPEEAKVASRWEKRHPSLVKQVIRHEKGTAVFRQGEAH